MPDAKDKMPTPSTLRIGAMLLAFALTTAAVLSGEAPSQWLIWFAILILAGAVLGKVIPHAGMGKPFVSLTIERAKSLGLTIAAWGGCFAGIAVLVAALIAFRSGEPIADKAGDAATWAAIIAGSAAAIVWTAQQVQKDVLILREQHERKPPQRRE
jgi:hypothetical protein